MIDEAIIAIKVFLRGHVFLAYYSIVFLFGFLGAFANFYRDYNEKFGNLTLRVLFRQGFSFFLHGFFGSITAFMLVDHPEKITKIPSPLYIKSFIYGFAYLAILDQLATKVYSESLEKIGKANILIVSDDAVNKSKKLKESAFADLKNLQANKDNQE